MKKNRKSIVDTENTIESLGFLQLVENQPGNESSGDASQLDRKQLLNQLMLPARIDGWDKSTHTQSLNLPFPGVKVSSINQRKPISPIENAGRSNDTGVLSHDRQSLKSSSDPLADSEELTALAEFEEVARNETLQQRESRIVANWPFALLENVRKSGGGVFSTLRPSPVNDIVSREWFDREIDLLQKAQHPNLLQVVELDQKNAIARLEPVVTTLSDRINVDGKLSPAACIRLLKGILSGLHVYHSQKLLFAELDIDRVLFDDQGNVKIAGSPGFRIGGELRPPKDKNRCIAPELLSPESFGSPTTAADIYTLGHVVLQALLGTRYREVLKANSISQSEVQSISQWHGSQVDNFPPLAELCPEIPELVPVLEKMIQKNVRARFNTVQQVLAELEKDVSLTSGGSSNASRKSVPIKVAKPIATIKSSANDLKQENADNAHTPTMKKRKSPLKLVVAFVLLLMAALAGLGLMDVGRKSNAESGDSKQVRAEGEKEKSSGVDDSTANPEIKEQLAVPTDQPILNSASGTEPAVILESAPIEKRETKMESVPEAEPVIAEPAKEKPAKTEPIKAPPLPDKKSTSHMVVSGPSQSEGQSDEDDSRTRSNSREPAKPPLQSMQTGAWKTSFGLSPSPGALPPNTNSFSTPDFRLNQVVDSPCVGTREQIKQLKEIFLQKHHSKQLEILIDKFYRDNQIDQNYDFRIDLFISYGFELANNQQAAIEAVQRGVAKTSGLQNRNNISEKGRLLFANLDMRYKPILQSLRLRSRKSNVKTSNEVIHDCYELAFGLPNEVRDDLERQALENIVSCLACILKQIELTSSNSTSASKTVNVSGYRIQIQDRLAEIDEGLAEHFEHCFQSLKKSSDQHSRLAFIRSLNLKIEMDSILRSLPDQTNGDTHTSKIANLQF